jgi:hypothetical protein
VIKVYSKVSVAKRKKLSLDPTGEENLYLEPKVEKRKKVLNLENIPKKVKTVKPPVPTPKEKAADEAEERLIAAAAERRLKTSIARKALPQGAQEIPDLTTAVKRGVKECTSLLLDWTSKHAKVVGSLCKVYWDGEDTWYYARVLNYDSFYKRHYVRLFFNSLSPQFILNPSPFSHL